MKIKDIPCRAADAVRHAMPVEVNGATVGLAMLDLVFAKVRDPGLTDESAVRAALLRPVKVLNYAPPMAAEVYAIAEYREYAKGNNQGGIR
jgi:hypothetical protein